MLAIIQLREGIEATSLSRSGIGATAGMMRAIFAHIGWAQISVRVCEIELPLLVDLEKRIPDHIQRRQLIEERGVLFRLALRVQAPEQRIGCLGRAVIISVGHDNPGIMPRTRPS